MSTSGAASVPEPGARSSSCFTVKQLEDRAPGSGIDEAPNVDIKQAIDNMGYRTPITTMAPPGY